MKKLSIVSLIGVFALSVILFGFLSQVSGQDFPKKNIRWVVPYSPGGGFDTYSRAIARTMKKYLPTGVNVIIMNKPGAGGQVATSLIYKAKPDGYTVGILPMPGLYVPQMFYKTKYDVKKLTWLGTVLNEPMVFALASSSKFKTLEDLKKAKSFRISGTGFTGPEIVAPITMETLGIKAKFITGHSGSKAAILAAMRGDGDAVVFSYGTMRKHVLGKSFKALLLIGAQKRSPEMPDVPIPADIGHPKLGLLGTYRVIGAPPDLPKDRENYLGNALLKSLNDPEFQKWAKKAKRPVTPMDGTTTKNTLLGVTSLYDKDYRGLLERYLKK
jgi:tripartite-type tricarboxylate transporter receptor subunit TctC